MVERKRYVYRSNLTFLPKQVILVAVSDIGALEPGLDAQSSTSIVVHLTYRSAVPTTVFRESGGHILDFKIFTYLTYF
jgi:hypothetical protein